MRLYLFVAVLEFESLSNEQSVNEFLPVAENAFGVALYSPLSGLDLLLSIGVDDEVSVLGAHHPAIVDGVREAAVSVEADDSGGAIELQLATKPVEVRHTAQMNAAMWKHVRLEELYVAELVAWHTTAFCVRRIVLFRLPVAVQVEFGVVANAFFDSIYSIYFIYLMVI